MSFLTPKDEYITCPYDPAHQILLSRLQTHLVKCEKSFKDKVKLVECPFNATHKVSELSLKCHTNYLCPDRRKLDTFISKNENEAKPAVPFRKVIVKAEIEENWDDDDDPTYNPEDHILKKPVLINKQCVPPAQRKEFRLLERQRFQQFENQNVRRPKPAPSTSQETPTERRPLESSQSKVLDVAGEPPSNQHLVSIKMAGLSINNDNNKSNDGFVVPKYAKGRGRGRLTVKN